jgi:hypothetical protein
MNFLKTRKVPILQKDVIRRFVSVKLNETVEGMISLMTSSMAK